MLIKNDFEVAQPVEKVWNFFGDIPQVATCLPGAELTEDLGGEKYKGQVAVRMGPVRMLFAGTGRSPNGTRRPSGWSSTRPAPRPRAAARPAWW